MDEQAAALVEARSEVLKLRAQLRRIEEERDILKKAARNMNKGLLSVGAAIRTGSFHGNVIERPVYFA